jgi:hypothetical protein
VALTTCSKERDLLGGSHKKSQGSRMMVMGMNELDAAPGADAEPCVQGRATARTWSRRRPRPVQPKREEHDEPRVA